MEYLDLLYILPVAAIAYVGARMAASHRRFERELEKEALAGFHDMAAAWRKSRTQAAAEPGRTTERQVPAGAHSASGLESNLR